MAVATGADPGPRECRTADAPAIGSATPLDLPVDGIEGDRLRQCAGQLQRHRHLPETQLTAILVGRGFAGHVRNADMRIRGERNVVEPCGRRIVRLSRSEEHTSELQSLMRIAYAV